jgi:hypothetical protein
MLADVLRERRLDDQSLLPDDQHDDLLNQFKISICALWASRTESRALWMRGESGSTYRSLTALRHDLLQVKLAFMYYVKASTRASRAHLACSRRPDRYKLIPVRTAATDAAPAAIKGARLDMPASFAQLETPCLRSLARRPRPLPCQRNDHGGLTRFVIDAELRERSTDVHGRPLADSAVVIQLVTHAPVWA